MRSRVTAVDPAMGRELELEIERLVHGPGALARADDGRVVLLDEGLPGECVRARVVEARRDFLRARVVRVLASPPEAGRRTPPCSIVALCGGCPWQPLAYERQLVEKEAVVLREIERGTGARPGAILPAIVGDEWRTRSRIRLAVARVAGSPTVGYRGRASHDVVGVDDCVIARAELVAALPLVRELGGAVPSLREVEVLVDDEAAVRLLGISASAVPIEAEPLLARLTASGESALGEAHLAGLRLEAAARHGARPREKGRGSTREPWAREAGDIEQRLEVAPGVVLHVPIGVFTQVNGTLNRSLVAAVTEAVGAVAGEEIVDLYCGAGNFSLPLAQAGARVVGIDADARAVRAAAASAARLALAERTSFTVLRAEAGGLEAALPERPACVVLDPPRAGAAAALPALLARRPDRIVYVSCDVATFARDARGLRAGGYELSSVRLIDLTPQTFRAELMGVFRLTW